MDAPKTWDDVHIEVPYGAYGHVRTLCPECSPKRQKSREKCLSVDLTDRVWLCHHCGWSGKLVSEEERSVTRVTRTFVLPEPPRETVLPESVVDYFAKRGIPDWVLRDSHITHGKDFSPKQGQEVSAIRFPYYRDGALVNIKHRAFPKDFWMTRGAERILYGLDGIKEAETICIVEGEIDKLSMDAVQGWPTVSVPDGAPPITSKDYQTKFTYLSGVAESYLRNAHTVLIATDGDEQGQKLGDELARRIGYAKCKKVAWPEGTKDANEVLVQLGAKVLKDLLVDAQPYPVAGIITPRDLAKPLARLYERGLDRGVELGFDRTFDHHYRVRPGLLTILTGKPGDGKSVFLDQMAVRLASMHEWAIAICSPEHVPLERHLSKIISIYTGKPFDLGWDKRISPEEMEAARQWTEDHFVFVLPEEPTVDAILDRCQVAVYRMGIRGVMIDPWTELDHARPIGVDNLEFISGELSKLRTFARSNGVHVWLSAHPTKLRRLEDGTFPVPSLYDISGSAHFANKADCGLSVWRDPNNPFVPTQVHVEKIRFAETGKVGAAAFLYDESTGIFTEADSPDGDPYGYTT